MTRSTDSYQVIAQRIKERAEKKINERGNKQIIPGIAFDLFNLIIIFLLPKEKKLFIPTLIRISFLNSISFFSFVFISELLKSGLLEQTFLLQSPMELERIARDGVEIHLLSNHGIPIGTRSADCDEKRVVYNLYGNKYIEVDYFQDEKGCMTLMGHENDILFCRISPDGRWIFSGSEDEMFKIWDVETGQCVRTLQHNGGVHACAISPDKKWIVTTTCHDFKFNIWDFDNALCVKTLSGYNDIISACAFSSNGKWIALGSLSGFVKIFDIEADSFIKMFSDANLVISCDFALNNLLLVLKGVSTVKIFSLAMCCCVHTLETDTRSCICAVSPDSQWIVTGSDNLVKIWSAAMLQCMATILLNASLLHCRFTQDGKRILVATRDNKIGFFSMMTGGGLILESDKRKRESNAGVPKLE